jgi:hypothetical protein
MHISGGRRWGRIRLVGGVGGEWTRRGRGNRSCWRERGRRGVRGGGQWFNRETAIGVGGYRKRREAESVVYLR